MKMTNNYAFAMLNTLYKMLNQLEQKDISSVIMFGITRNVRILSNELKEYMTLRTSLIQKYKIDTEHATDKDIEERIAKCNEELKPVGEEEIEVNLHHIKYGYDEFNDALENADILLNMFDVQMLQQICRIDETV